MIDAAVHYAITRKKPVYLEIPCNLSTIEVLVPIANSPSQVMRCDNQSDHNSLQSALHDILHALKESVRPILIAGSHLRYTNSASSFQKLAEMLGCAMAVMPDAKGLISEQHPLYIGRYWGPVSTPYVAELVESSDLIIFGGPVMNDYTTTGWNIVIPKEKIIALAPTSASFGEVYYPNVQILDVLNGLTSKKLFKRDHSMRSFTRLNTKEIQVVKHWQDDDELSLPFLKNCLQQSLTPSTTLLTETGDCWFIGQSLHLPEGCKYHVQMQYGSIGWSVGATLGIALAEPADRKVVALIGDGSFQMTCQEISSMIRHRVNVTIILVNNDGYTIESQIHDGPYNDIKMWNYEAFVKSLATNQIDQIFTSKVTTNQEFQEALHQSYQRNGLCFIECIIKRDDCTSELLQWGTRVAKANSRQVK